MSMYYGPDLERKYCRLGEQVELGSDATIEGYASLFGVTDQGGDVVKQGAYEGSLKRIKTSGSKVKLLWQHDPSQPIGVWDEVHEDAKGLFVKGRLLTETRQGFEAAALIQAGALDGLSIGYRTVKAERDAKGLRHLAELELWEVSLVTFPMLQQARVGAKADTYPADPATHALADAFRELRQSLSAR